MGTDVRAPKSDDDDCVRIARTILAAMQAAGYSGELVADDTDNEIVRSPSITGMSD